MSELQVSDRALLRFLEQAGELDIEGLRAQLEASLARAHEAAERMGGGDYLIQSGRRSFVVRDGVVVTLLKGAPRSYRHATLGKRRAAE